MSNLNIIKSIKIIIGCLIILILVLFGVNQYNQYQYVQEQKRIEEQTKKQNEKIIENNEKESQKGSPLKNIKGGTL